MIKQKCFELFVDHIYHYLNMKEDYYWFECLLCELPIEDNVSIIRGFTYSYKMYKAKFFENKR